jgi:hypothetical protein
MSTRKNSASRHWIFDSPGFSFFYRMFPQAVRLAGAASLFVGIVAGGAASAQTKAATVTSLSISASGSVAAGTVVTQSESSLRDDQRCCRADLDTHRQHDRGIECRESKEKPLLALGQRSHVRIRVALCEAAKKKR